MSKTIKSVIIENADKKTIFKGQYLIALEKLFKGETVDISDFDNGSWEPTSKISHFIGLLKISGLWGNFRIAKNGNSLRNTDIQICENYYMFINDIFDLDCRNNKQIIIKYYFNKEKFYVFEFEEGFNPEKYNKLQVTIDYKNNQYSIWGIKGTIADLLEENYLNYFDASILCYAEKTETDEIA